MSEGLPPVTTEDILRHCKIHCAIGETRESTAQLKGQRSSGPAEVALHREIARRVESRDALLKAAKEAEAQIKEWRTQVCSWEQAIQEKTSLEHGERIRARFAELMRDAGYEIF